MGWKFIGWLWCNGRIWPNVVYFLHTSSIGVAALNWIPVVYKLSSWTSKKSSTTSMIFSMHYLSDTASQPSVYVFRFSFSCWVTEDSQTVPTKENIEVINLTNATVTHSSHSNHRFVCANIVLVKQDSLHQCSRPFRLNCLSQLPQKGGIVFCPNLAKGSKWQKWHFS